MKKVITKYGIMIALIPLGLWSGQSAALHIDERMKSSPQNIEHVKVDLPILVTAITKSGQPTMIVRGKFTPSIPVSAQSNPAINDMLTDALLKATVETFYNPTDEMLIAPEIAINKIVNLANERLPDFNVDELEVTNLIAFKYLK